MHKPPANKPRILISYFFGQHTIPLGASCAAALRELGWDVHCFNSQAESPLNRYCLKYINKLIRGLGFKSADITKGSRWNNDAFRQRRLERAVAAFRPDVLLVIRGNSFEAGHIRRLKSRYAIRKTVGWWVKDPRGTSEMSEDAAMYDHYFCIHRFGYGPGDGIHHLPALAVDRSLYHPLPGQKSFRHDIVFVGGWSPRREEMLLGLADLPLEIYGPGWRKLRRRSGRGLWKKVRAGQVWGDALNRLYNSSRIVLNISSWEPQRTGLNLRTFDVPATGAFLLTDDSAELEQHFVKGVEMETFATPEELRRKAAYFLRHDEEREAMARRGHEKVLGFESYADKMKALLETIGEYGDEA